MASERLDAGKEAVQGEQMAEKVFPQERQQRPPRRHQKTPSQPGPFVENTVPGPPSPSVSRFKKAVANANSPCHWVPNKPTKPHLDLTRASREPLPVTSHLLPPTYPLNPLSAAPPSDPDPAALIDVGV